MAVDARGVRRLPRIVSGLDGIGLVEERDLLPGVVREADQGAARADPGARGEGFEEGRPDGGG